MQKYDFFKYLKWPPFCGILSNLAQILHCTPGPPKIYVCLLPLAMSVTSLVGITEIDLQKVRNCYFSPQKWPPFPTFKVVWGKICGQGATPSSAATKICWNNRNTCSFWEKCNNVISDLKNGHHFPRLRSFEVKFADKMPIPLTMSLPIFVGIVRIVLEKCKKLF